MDYLKQIKAISFFSTSLSDKKTVEEVLWDITENVIHQLGFVDCVIYELDESDEILLQRAAYGDKNPAGKIIYNQITIKMGKGIVGSVAKNRQAELVKDTSKDKRYIIDDAMRLSELCVPIIVNNKLFGVIDSEHPQKNFFTEEHLYMLNIVAALCGQKIKEIRSQEKKPLSKSNKYFRKLEELMRYKKLYRNPNLNLNYVAQQLGISSCYLSNLTNSILNISFIDYINGYRVRDVKNHLHCDHFSHYTILSVGLEAGFNSKSTFYHAFKKHVGMSPSEYKEEQPELILNLF